MFVAIWKVGESFSLVVCRDAVEDDIGDINYYVWVLYIFRYA